MIAAFSSSPFLYIGTIIPFLQFLGKPSPLQILCIISNNLSFEQYIRMEIPCPCRLPLFLFLYLTFYFPYDVFLHDCCMFFLMFFFLPMKKYTKYCLYFSFVIRLEILSLFLLFVFIFFIFFFLLSEFFFLAITKILILLSFASVFFQIFIFLCFPEKTPELFFSSLYILYSITFSRTFPQKLEEIKLNDLF